MDRAIEIMRSLYEAKALEGQNEFCHFCGLRYEYDEETGQMIKHVCKLEEESYED